MNFYSSSITVPRMSYNDTIPFIHAIKRFATCISKDLYYISLEQLKVGYPCVSLIDMKNQGLDQKIVFDFGNGVIDIKVRITGPGNSELSIFLGTLLRQILIDIKRNKLHLILTQEEKDFAEYTSYNQPNGYLGYYNDIKDEEVAKQFLNLYTTLNITVPITF